MSGSGKDRLRPDQSGDGSRSPSRLSFRGFLDRRNTGSSQASSSRDEVAGPSAPWATDEKRPANPFTDPDQNHGDNPFNDPPPSYDTAFEASPANPFAGASSTSEKVPSKKLPEYTITKEMIGDASNFKFLSHFEVKFLIDDSGSMWRADGHNGLTRWQEVGELINGITGTCVEYDKTGIDVYFLNHSKPYYNITSSEKVLSIFQNVVPKGQTPLGSRLGVVLHEYLDEYEKNTATKPTIIIVVTDGEPTECDEAGLDRIPTGKEWEQEVARRRQAPVVKAIRDALHRLLAINKDAQKCQFGIQLFQVGMDAAAKQFLQRLDNGLQEEDGFPPGWDVVDTASFDQNERGQNPKLTPRGLLKVVGGAVWRHLDYDDTVHRELPAKEMDSHTGGFRSRWM